jgi:hypothetical protein
MVARARPPSRPCMPWSREPGIHTVFPTGVCDFSKRDERRPRGRSRGLAPTRNAVPPDQSRCDSPHSAARRWAVKLITLSPKGWASGSRALDEAETPTSPGSWSWLLTKRARQFACSGFADPNADGARAPNTPELASSRRATRRRIPSSLPRLNLSPDPHGLGWTWSNPSARRSSAGRAWSSSSKPRSPPARPRPGGERGDGSRSSLPDSAMRTGRWPAVIRRRGTNERGGGYERRIAEPRRAGGADSCWAPTCVSRPGRGRRSTTRPAGPPSRRRTTRPARSPSRRS